MLDYREQIESVAGALLMRYADLGGDLTGDDETGVPFAGDDCFGLCLNPSGDRCLEVTPGSDPVALWPYVILTGAEVTGTGLLAMSWEKWQELEGQPPEAWSFSGKAVRELHTLLLDLSEAP